MTDSALFRCPRCRTSYEDEWECLAQDEPTRVKCYGCGEHFALLIKECLSCAEESIFIWEFMPSPDGLAALFCQSCGKGFNETDEATHPEVAGTG